MKTIINLLTFLGGSVVKTIAGDLSRAYLAKLDAETDEKKYEAEVVISEMESHLALLLKEQDRAMTAWIRPAFASLAWVYWAKIIVWDTVLGLGVTPMPSDLIEWFVVLIPSIYFILRPTEKSGEGILQSLSFRK